MVWKPIPSAVFLRLHEPVLGRLVLVKWTHISTIEPTDGGGSEIGLYHTERPVFVVEPPGDVIALIVEMDPPPEPTPT